MEKNKVLIVDDISENIKTISEMIKDFDIDVKTANGGKEAIELIEVFILVGNTWNKDVAYPYRLVDLAEIAGTIEYVLIAMKRQLAMLFIIDMLDIKKNGIGNGHQTLEFLKEFSFFLKWLRRGIKTGIDATLMGFLEKFDEKVYLHQGFSTAHGDATRVSPITFESLCLVQKVISCPFLSHSRLPRIRVVAELAAHGTAFKKDDKPNARAIDRTERL